MLCYVNNNMLNPQDVFFFSFQGTTTESEARKKRSGSHQPSDYLDETVARKRALSVASILTNTMEGLKHTDLTHVNKCVKIAIYHNGFILFSVISEENK